jgi:hypothetical protein
MSSLGTGSGLSRRIERVVRIISNWSVVSEVTSGVALSVMSAPLKSHGAGHNRAASCPMQGDPSYPASRRDRVTDPVI